MGIGFPSPIRFHEAHIWILVLSYRGIISMTRRNTFFLGLKKPTRSTPVVMIAPPGKKQTALRWHRRLSL
jgi:hypothetical protein